jgi:hypothetical protein
MSYENHRGNKWKVVSGGCRSHDELRSTSGQASMVKPIAAGLHLPAAM